MAAFRAPCGRGGGKSGLHGNTVPGNTRRGRPQGKCHRKQTAGSGLGPPARVKGCGKSAPRPRQRGRQGKPHREQDQVGTARRGLVRQGPRNRQAGFRAAVRVGRARRPVTGVPDEWPSSASADTEPGLQAVWRLPFRRRVVPNAGFPRRERTETSGIAEDGLIPRGAERLQNSRRTSAHLGALGVENNSNAEDAEERKGTTRSRVFATSAPLCIPVRQGSEFPNLRMGEYRRQGLRRCPRPFHPWVAQGGHVVFGRETQIANKRTYEEHKIARISFLNRPSQSLGNF